MISRVDLILTTNIDDEAEEVTFLVVDTAPQNPYLHYTAENGEVITKLSDEARKSRSQSRTKSHTRNNTSTTKETRSKSTVRK
jgi:hypothetical protein